VGLQRGLDVSRSLLLHTLTCANRNEKLLNSYQEVAREVVMRMFVSLANIAAVADRVK
jgi:hypothetical protein